MSKKSNKTYVFSKEKCVAHLKKVHIPYDPECDDPWMDECEGKVVKFRDARNGFIGVFEIEKSWCVEVTV